MGLAGRKVKQRIPADPRNLSWADDAAKFGSNYLTKFGWDSSKGLGANGEGRTSHIKVVQKLDFLGVGAAHQKDPDGIAWKQNKDFEDVLKRLNEGASTESSSEDGETAATESKLEKEAKRRRKDEKGSSEQKAKKKRKAAEATDPNSLSSETFKCSSQRHRTHRARATTSKSKSEASIAEILCISRTSSSCHPDPETHNWKFLPLAQPNNDATLEQITTSSKSVTDYFKEKLSSKIPRFTSGSAAPHPRQTDETRELDADIPRHGLGSSSQRAENLGVGTLPLAFSPICLAQSSQLFQGKVENSVGDKILRKRRKRADVNKDAKKTRQKAARKTVGLHRAHKQSNAEIDVSKRKSDQSYIIS